MGLEIGRGVKGARGCFFIKMKKSCLGLRKTLSFMSTDSCFVSTVSFSIPLHISSSPLAPTSKTLVS